MTKEEEVVRNGARRNKYQMESYQQTGIMESFRRETGVMVWKELLVGV